MAHSVATRHRSRGSGSRMAMRSISCGRWGPADSRGLSGFAFTSLNQFLPVYDVLCQVLQAEDDFRRITYESLEDAVAAGVVYRESFFSPGFAYGYDVPIETVWEGIKWGLADAHADLDVKCRMILDFDKPRLAGHAMEMAEFAAAEPDRDLLIGVGADSIERDIDHRVFGAAFTRAAREDRVSNSYCPGVRCGSVGRVRVSMPHKLVY